MKKIIFERRPQVYLPEISAYLDYISKHMDGWVGYESSDIENYSPLDYDVIWRFMGVDACGKGRKVIHEYNSLSTGLFANGKNQVKKFLNAKPDARVFLNEMVRSKFSFNDGVQSSLRDMGIGSVFFDRPEAASKKEYDFVYSGSLHGRGSVIIKALDYFKFCFKGATLLVIGSVPDEIYNEYRTVDNIVFAGRLNYSDVPLLARKAKYGLNLMPDIYPLNSQTATKVLEYCALGLPIISTDYKWIREFETKRRGKFFYLQKDFENLTLQNIDMFNFYTPQVEDLEWNNLIEASGVFNFLEN